MAAKAKPRTGGAVTDDSQPDTNDVLAPIASPSLSAPISDAQSTKLAPQSTGFVATPSAPGPSGPSFGMGGDVTQPSDFAQEVAAATNVPSKGGRPVEDLYASSGKGPVGKLKKPSETTSTAKPPEEVLAPIAPPSLSAPSTPAAAPAATPPATSTTAAGTTTAAQTTEQAPARGAPETLPAFQDHGDLIEQYAKHEQRGSQDYSRVDPYIANDPEFAGLRWGVPIFMGGDNRVYFRDETAPGEGIRHYADAAMGTHEADNGVPYKDDGTKMQASRNAQAQMLGLLQTQDAINNWRQKLAKVQAEDPSGKGESALQRWGLQTLLSGSTDPMSNAFRTVVDMIQGQPGLGPGLGITKDMKDLDAARAQIAVAYTKAQQGGQLPTSAETRTALNLPLTADDFDTQDSRVNAMQAEMRREADALQKLYPHANRQVEALLKQMAQGKGATGQSAQQSTTSGPRKPTLQEMQSAPVINTQEDIKKYPSGTLVRDVDGKLRYTP